MISSLCCTWRHALFRGVESWQVCLLSVGCPCAPGLLTACAPGACRYQYCEELPNIICYDNSCSLSTVSPALPERWSATSLRAQYCLRREYSTFRKCRFLVDKWVISAVTPSGRCVINIPRLIHRFHSKGHTCSRVRSPVWYGCRSSELDVTPYRRLLMQVMHADEDNARLLKQGEAVGRNATSWAEHWHSFLGCCSASMPTMSLERYVQRELWRWRLLALDAHCCICKQTHAVHMCASLCV